MPRRLWWALVLVAAAMAGCAHVAPPAVDVADRFEEVRRDPDALARFMRAFPKGGDIHHHLVGAPTPETLIDVGIEQGFCLHPQSLEVAPGPCAAPLRPVEDVVDDAAHRERLIDLWSMRGFGRGDPRAADHFFGIFPKIWPVVSDRGELLARLMIGAHAENVSYLETQLQVPEPTDRLRALAMAAPDAGDVLVLRTHLRASGQYEAIVEAALDGLSRYRDTAARRLGCASGAPHPACAVTVRFQIYALRILPPPMVLADMILAFELAARSPDVVAVNVVGYEGDANALANYAAHMDALAALSRVYPDVIVAPHAGEITAREADAEALGNHVPLAVYVAGARRIGHGVAVATSHERDRLLAHLARTGTAVEVCLTSNELLLGLAGNDHPLALLWEAGVPVVLATDDAGIFRTDLSREFALAATRYGWLDYDDFKTLARRSIDVSFLPGRGLWQDRSLSRRTGECADLDSTACRDFAARHPRAAVAVDLERRLAAFEARVRAGEL